MGALPPPHRLNCRAHRHHVLWPGPFVISLLKGRSVSPYVCGIGEKEFPCHPLQAPPRPGPAPALCAPCWPPPELRPFATPPVSVGAQGGARPFNWRVPSPSRAISSLGSRRSPSSAADPRGGNVEPVVCFAGVVGPQGVSGGREGPRGLSPPLRAPWSSPKMAATMKKAVSGRSRAGARAAGAGPPRGRAGGRLWGAHPRGRRGARGRAPEPEGGPAASPARSRRPEHGGPAALARHGAWGAGGPPATAPGALPRCHVRPAPGTRDGSARTALGR